MQNLDLFDKVSDTTLRESTRYGEVASLIFLSLTVVCMIGETNEFMRPEIYRDLVTDADLVDQQERINISISVLVSSPCYYLHLDVLDVMGYKDLNINSTVTFRRIDRNGKLIDIAKQTLETECRPCYGLLPEGRCCRTCERLINLAKAQGKPVEMEKWEQCGSNNITKGRKTVDSTEKCLVKGKVTINRINGNFHIAPGRNVKNRARHIHDLHSVTDHLCMNHTLQRIRFGPKIPTVRQPLQNTKMESSVGISTNWRHLLLATPVIYKKNGKIVEQNGWEYQTMTVQQPVHTVLSHTPGIFFEYSFSPYSLLVHARTRSPFIYMTTTAAVMSGIFAILTLVESVAAKSDTVDCL